MSTPAQQLRWSLRAMGGMGCTDGRAGPLEVPEAWPRSLLRTRVCFSLGKGEQ